MKVIVISKEGAVIPWPECQSDAESGKVICGEYCQNCAADNFRSECKEKREQEKQG